MNSGPPPAQASAGHAGNAGPRFGHITGPGKADGHGYRDTVYYVRDDETGTIYSFGYADIMTEGFRSLRSGERVRFLAELSRPGRASYVIRLDLPDMSEYYK